jgi:hypothetical protein
MFAACVVFMFAVFAVTQLLPPFSEMSEMIGLK